MNVYEEEIGFLNFCRDLLSQVVFNPDTQNIHKGFKGLSKEGQVYLGDLFSIKSYQYVLGKGGVVKGEVLRNNKRVKDYSIVSHPVKLDFSNTLYQVMLALFDESRPLPEDPMFSCGDNIILLLLAELCFSDIQAPPQESNEIITKIAAHAFLPGLFFMGQLDSDASSFKASTERFINDQSGPELMFSLRYYMRDMLVDQIWDVINNQSYEIMVNFGSRLDSFSLPMFDIFSSNGFPELFEPFCQIYELLFHEKSHIEIINQKIQRDVKCEYESDENRARSKLYPFYSWVNELGKIHKKSLITGPFHYNFYSLIFFKQYYNRISQ